MQNTTIDYNNDYEMSSATVLKVWDRQQKFDAKHADYKVDRKKTELTTAEKMLKLVQFGKVARYKDICFYFNEEMGWYVLENGNHRCYNSSIGDFYKAVEDKYGIPLHKMVYGE